MGTLRIGRGGIGRGQRAVAVALLAATLAGNASGPAFAASSSGGSGISRFVEKDITAPSPNPEMAQRQAVGCTVVGLGVTGVAVASGALAMTGSGGSGFVPVSAAIGQIITYFGAGCTIGAFLAGLFPVRQPAFEDVGG
jgi:hypothetical protein